MIIIAQVKEVMIIENRENTYYGQEYKSGILRLFPAFSQLVGGATLIAEIG